MECPIGASDDSGTVRVPDVLLIGNMWSCGVSRTCSHARHRLDCVWFLWGWLRPGSKGEAKRGTPVVLIVAWGLNAPPSARASVRLVKRPQLRRELSAVAILRGRRH